MPLYVQIKQSILRQYYRRSYWFQRLPMNQKLLIIFLPIIFLLGTILFLRSNPTTPGSFTIASDKPVQVDFFVMSRCPDAQKCETLFAPSLLKLSPIINFTVSFIAYQTKPNEIQCMHGPDECLGNKQQLCVQNLCSQTTLIKFLQCQSRQMMNIPNNGEQCFKEVSDNTLKWSDIETCVNSEKSNELFHKSLEKTRLASAKKSCTIYLNGKSWCTHDGTWYSCDEGHDEKSFIKAICSRYNGTNKPAECSTTSA